MSFIHELEAAAHKPLPKAGSVKDLDEAARTIVHYSDVILTADEIDALNATPVTVLAAPGAGKLLRFEGAHVFLDYGGTAWAGSSQTIQFRYTDGSGAVCGTITEAFLESTADAYFTVMGVSCIPVVNAAIVAYGTADFTTGNSPLYMRLFYRVIPVLEI